MELIGAAIITFFNIFTIWYKMKVAPPEENDDKKQDPAYELSDMSRKAKHLYRVNNGDSSDDEKVALMEDHGYNEANFALEMDCNELRDEWDKTK